MDAVKEVKIDVNMTDKILFHFMMVNTLSKISGKIMWGVSTMCLILLPFSLFMADTMTSFILFIMVFMSYGVQPLTLYTSAKKQMLTNPLFKETMHYKIDEQGIGLKQNAQNGNVEWANIIKVIEAKKAYLFYISDIQAFIMPKESMDYEQEVSLRNLIQNNGIVKKYKLKKLKG